MTRALVAVFLASLVCSGAAFAQQSDHLACVSVSDPGVEGPLPVAISEVIDDEFSDCVIKKARLTSLCVRIAKDGGDDPRGGLAAAEAYGCYQIKCEGSANGSVFIDDQFGGRSVIRKALRTLCTPVEVSGAVP